MTDLALATENDRGVLPIRVFPVIIAAAVLFAACGGGGVSRSADTGRTISIDMRDFAFSPAIVMLKPGERVTLSLRNVGTVEHELMAGKDAMAGKGYMQDWLAMARLEPIVNEHGTSHSGEGVRVLPRGTASLTVVVPPLIGEFEFGCFVEGHYESGMIGRFVVVADIAPNAIPTVPQPAIPGTSSRPAATPAPTGLPMNEMDMDGH